MLHNLNSERVEPGNGRDGVKRGANLELRGQQRADHREGLGKLLDDRIRVGAIGNMPLALQAHGRNDVTHLRSEFAARMARQQRHEQVGRPHELGESRLQACRAA